MNAFVLAGDQGERARIGGVNKAFLMLEGQPVLIHVLSALDQVRAIDRIYVVGPRKQVMASIERALPYVLFAKKIEVLEQKRSLIENILSAYAYSLPGYREGTDPTRLPGSDAPGLFLPADIPLVSPSEISAFIAASDMEKYDYCLGVTPEAALTRFYPAREKPGIRMPYLYLKEKAYRMNNLHLGRPYRVGIGVELQKMYDYRHQRSAGNRFQIARAILKVPRRSRKLFFYLLAQGAVFFMQAGLPSIASLFRRPLTLDQVEKEVASFLQTRFKAVETEEGGAALDIDDEESYKTISLGFRAWRAELGRFDEGKGREEACPFKTGSCS